MRTRYIQDPDTLQLVPAEDYYGSREPVAPMVMPDIQPYKSMLTGELISSRSTHRAHLKQHGMVEVGNEKLPTNPRRVPDVGGLRQELYARITG